MNSSSSPGMTAFDGQRRIASGPLDQVASTVRPLIEKGAPILVFDDASGARVDIARDEDAAAETPRPRGRPRLGVVPREVTLMPRHWDWLSAQPGGASVAMRKLVEAAMRSPEAGARAAKEAAYKVATALAGDLPGYEEAMRALFAGDEGRFTEKTEAWPADVRDYARTLASAAFA